MVIGGLGLGILGLGSKSCAAAALIPSLLLFDYPSGAAVRTPGRNPSLVFIVSYVER